MDPNSVEQDKVFFSALLVADANVTVQIGNNTPVVYHGVQGINHWSQPFNGQTGVVTFTVIKDVDTALHGTGAAITSTTGLSNGCTNYNFWAGSF